MDEAGRPADMRLACHGRRYCLDFLSASVSPVVTPVRGGKTSVFTSRVLAASYGPFTVATSTRISFSSHAPGSPGGSRPKSAGCGADHRVIAALGIGKAEVGVLRAGSG